MCYQEKQSIITLISSIVITIAYVLYICPGECSDVVLNDTSFWAKRVLILIPVSIVFQIIITILFTIAHRIVTGKDEPNITDEMDKIIALKSARNGYVVFSIGVLIAVATQAFSLPVVALYLTILGFGLVTSVVDAGSQLFFYRRGV